MRIIFMGTPDFAVPALQKLIESKHEIVGVYTKPPKPAGRGYKEIKSKVHMLAEKHNLPIFTPPTFKNEAAVKQFQDLNADVAVVVAYGLILRKVILDSPKHGCINIHPSKLPRWRGAAPLQRTIMAGDRDTAVCIMQMDEGMDTGDIILQKDFPVSDEITAKELHDELSVVGAEGVIETLELIESGKAVRTPQSEKGVTHAAKLTREDEILDWNKSAREIQCQIRALSPRPGAYFKYNDETIKIIVAEYSEESTDAKPGTVIDSKLSVACNGGILRPKLLQREGRKMIYTDAFLRGFPIDEGTQLQS